MRAERSAMVALAADGAHGGRGVLGDDGDAHGGQGWI